MAKASVRSAIYSPVSDEKPDVALLLVNGAVPLKVRPELTDGKAQAFSWGDKSPGAKLLAVAILADIIKDDALAKSWADDFLADKVSKLPRAGWELHAVEVCNWMVKKMLTDLLNPPAVEAVPDGVAHGG